MRVLSSLAICVVAWAMPSVAMAQGKVFRSRVDMVALTVTVTDATGQCVSGLSAGDFAIFEDGVRQDVSLFGSEDVPVDVAFILDTSSSMVGVLPVVKKAARGLLDTLRDRDRASVVDVKGRIGIPQSLTSDRTRVAAAIGGLAAKGTTALYDGVYMTLNEFARERRTGRDEVRRQALVVLSDGIDTVSHVPFDAVTDLARSLDVTIYTISMRDVGLPIDLRDDLVLRRATWEMGSLARETGGRAFFPTRILELQGVYDTIARELAHQYALAYVSSAPVPDGAFRRIGLKLLPPAQGTPRTRTGYLSKTSSAEKVSEELKER